MKNTLLIILAILFSNVSYSQFCNTSGNLIIYTNYDGGTLTINVDQNIPNLKIGIVSYEAVSVNITGAFVGNVTAVEWAGYNANNGHCSPNVPTTVITGVSSSIVTMSTMPAATYSDPNGYGNIICAYSCGSGNQGGCNTAGQVADYFLNSLGGSLYYHYLQYGCWNSTLAVSSGGNCCDQPVTNNPPIADFTFPATNYCMDDCIIFTDNSTNTPTSWSWSFSGGNPSTSNLQNPTVCYNNTGTYSISLTVQNAFGSDTYSTTVNISSVNTSVSLINSTLTALTSGATYQWYDCNLNQNISGETSQSFTPQANGSYAAIITENGCTDTSGCVAVNVSGINENYIAGQLEIFPNPSSGEVKIKIINQELSGKEFVLENMLGQIFMNDHLDLNGQLLDLSYLANGTYFLKVNSENGMISLKIIKN